MMTLQTLEELRVKAKALDISVWQDGDLWRYNRQMREVGTIVANNEWEALIIAIRPAPKDDGTDEGRRG